MSSSAACVRCNSVASERKSTITLFKSSTVHGFSHLVEQKKKGYKIFWCFGLFVCAAACLLHLFFLLRTFVISPNETTIAYENSYELEMPRLHICPTVSRGINWDKFRRSGYNEQYLYAIELGLGLVFDNSDQLYTITVDLEAVEKEYKTAVHTHGSILAAAEAFYSEFGLECRHFIKECFWRGLEPFNCCSVFEKLFTMQGPCFVSKKGALRVGGWKTELNILLRDFNKCKFNRYQICVDESHPEAVEKEALKIAIESTPEQSLDFASKSLLNIGESVSFSLKMIERKLLQDGLSGCRNENKAKYFQNYTVFNCFWEKEFFAKLPLLGLECQMPILGILNKQLDLNNPCSLEQLLKFFDYHPAQNPPLDPVFWKDEMQQNPPFLDMKELPHCWLPGSEKPGKKPCDLFDVLRAAGVRSESLERGHNSYISIHERFAAIDNASKKLEYSDDNPCPTPCTYTDYLYSHSKTTVEKKFEGFAQIRMRFENDQVELVREVYRQSWSEYISLVGSNISMWVGASMISMAHFLMLSVRAFSSAAQTRLAKSKKSQCSCSSQPGPSPLSPKSIIKGLDTMRPRVTSKGSNVRFSLDIENY